MYSLDAHLCKMLNDNGTPKMCIVDLELYKIEMLNAANIGYVK